MNRRAQQKLQGLAKREINYDPDGPHDSLDGWRHDLYRQTLGREAPGEPVEGGLFLGAQDLLRNYKVADPDLVEAIYDTEAPLEGRNMLLKLRFHKLFGVYGGCRVGPITDEVRQEEGKEARVWGWPYMTLQGHVEQGEMNWEVWKWLESGVVEFRIHAFSRGASDGNPFVRLGFRLFGQRERERYLNHACARMVEFTRRDTA